jgi:D-alanyl-D-alanine carboxypeptidase
MKYFLLIIAVCLLILALMRTVNGRRRRRRNRSVELTTTALYVLAIALGLVAAVFWLLPGNAPDDPPAFSDPAASNTTSPSQQDTQPPETTSPYGWKQENGLPYYLKEDGTKATGWYRINDRLYRFNDDGTPYSGWLEDNGVTYYILPGGAMARGQVEIDGVRHFFTSGGREILLVNPWNSVPEGYEPDLVDLSIYYAAENSKVDRSCYDALIRMIDECNKEAPRAAVASSYRTHEYQTRAYESKVRKLKEAGMSEEEARKEAATVIAVPGTSEHQLGLAVDIIDTRLWALEEEQETLPAQQWLMANSWRYGFILRYPKDKIDSTGIIYEPWHYRYVGVDVAKEIYESGLTLEEYIENLTDK